MAEAVHGDGHKCRGRGRRTTGMQGNSHEQSSESIEWIALGFHCSLRAHECRPAAAQPPSATPHAVHFGGHTHGLAIVHGIRRYGWKHFVVFFIVAFVISWSYETLSILTGFPFGHYIYTDNLGPKLWLVPLLIMPAYFSMGYIAWTLAHVLLDRYDDRLAGAEVVLVPALASFVMVMWDLCIDPASSTISGSWIWRDGGGYFGVPLVNFLGWYLCVFTIYLMFALYLQRSAEWTRATNLGDRSTWTLPALMYAAVMLPRLLEPAVSD